MTTLLEASKALALKAHFVDLAMKAAGDFYREGLITDAQKAEILSQYEEYQGKAKKAGEALQAAAMHPGPEGTTELLTLLTDAHASARIVLVRVVNLTGPIPDIPPSITSLPEPDPGAAPDSIPIAVSRVIKLTFEEMAQAGADPKVVEKMQAMLRLVTVPEVFKAMVSHQEGKITQDELAKVFEPFFRKLFPEEIKGQPTHATIPTEINVPILFNVAPEHGHRTEEFTACRVMNEDMSVIGIAIEMKVRGGKDGPQLTLLDEDFVSQVESAKYLPGSPEYQAGVLALLPKVVGPELLALYYSLFFATDGEGVFPWHPTPFLKLLGLGNDTANKRLWSERLGKLATIQLDVRRDYGKERSRHDSGTLIAQIPTFRTMVFPGFGGRRLEYRYFAHHPAIMENRKRAFIRLPREAFELVGKWNPGRGSNDAGIRANSFLTTSYVFARMFVSRKGRQKDATYHGVKGYEIPLRRILLASGFTTPERFAKNPGETIERAHEAIERLRGEFRLLGPGSDVKGDRFLFDPTETLKTDLAQIVETPPASRVIDSPPKKRRGRRKA